MKIKEVMAILEQFDPQTEVNIDLSYEDIKLDRCELRDLVSGDGYTEGTIAFVWGCSSIKHIYGFPHLSKKQKADKKRFILMTLAGHTDYRFTTIHGDLRFYLPMGTVNDTCYGEGYDPRLFRELEERGYLQGYKEPHSRPGYKLTERGRSITDRMWKKQEAERVAYEASALGQAFRDALKRWRNDQA